MQLSPQLYQSGMHGIIQRHFGFRRNAAKLLSALTGKSPRTCESWLAGLHAPSGDALLNLMRANEELAAEINRLGRAP